MTRLLNDEQTQLALHRSCARAGARSASLRRSHTLSSNSFAWAHRIPRPHAGRTGYPAHTLILFRRK
jgi:hypothetical protein